MAALKPLALGVPQMKAPLFLALSLGFLVSGTEAFAAKLAPGCYTFKVQSTRAFLQGEKVRYYMTVGKGGGFLVAAYKHNCRGYKAISYSRYCSHAQSVNKNNSCDLR